MKVLQNRQNKSANRTLFAAITTAILGFSFILFSCNNFSSGSDFKQKLEEEIAYAKAPAFSVRVAADNGTGSIVTGAGDKTVKVTDTLNLEFEESDSYQFLYWTAIDKDSGTDLSDYVNFTPTDSEVTAAKILKQGNILIKPVCAIRPAVTDFSPQDTDSGVAKNSTIRITFNQTLSSENDLSKIAVTVNGENVLRYFKYVGIEENSIVLMADIDNPIPVDSGKKIVTVNIPAGLFYKTADGKKIETRNEVQRQYTINSNLNIQAKIDFSFPAGSGILTVGGEAFTQNETKIFNYGDELKISFEEVPSYQFIGWNIKNAGTADGSIVTLDDEKSTKTTVKIKGQSEETKNVEITAVCAERPVVVSFLPDTSASSSTSVPVDSDIEITFSKPLAASNNLNEITIFMDGYSVGEYFPERTIKDKLVTLKADKHKIIPNVFGTKTIVVTIPSYFYYEDGTESEKITLASQISKNYRINSTTTNKATVNFNRKNAEGDISITGDKVLYTSDEISVSFVPSKEYVLDDWSILLENGSPVDEEILSRTVSSDKQTLTVKLLNGYENQKILITPVCHPKPKLLVHFSTKYGSTVPAEEKTLFPGDEFALNYREESGYAFTEWTVIDDSTGKEITDAIEIGTGKDVTVKVQDIKEDKSITINAQTIDRPRIVSTTPAYDTDGVYRDRPIVIMFNKEMSEKSIYWTEKELADMNIPLANAFKADEITYKDENDIEQPYYYAYWDGNNPNSYVYKNISITKYTNESINYLQYYGIPRFDNSNTRVLRIPTKILYDENKKPVSFPPPSATDILVTVSKNLFYKCEEKEIALSEGTSWAYATNMYTDTFPPEFDTSTFEVRIADKDQTAYNSSNPKIDDAVLTSLKATPETNIPKYNARTKALWVKGKFTDSGSGPANLQWYITKVASEYYPDDESKLVAQGKILDLSIQGTNASIGTGENASVENGGVLIDISANLENGFEDLPEGTFALYFDAFDKNGQKATSEPFYFVYDVIPPKKSEVELSVFADNVVTVLKKVDEADNYYKTDIDGIEYKENDSKQFNNLFADSLYHTVTTKDYDFAGNCTTTDRIIIAMPKVGDIFYDDCYWSSIDVLDNAVETGRMPVGIILDVYKTNTGAFDNKVKIIAIDRDSTARSVITGTWDSSYPYGWGEDHPGTLDTAIDGLQNYNAIVSNVNALGHSEVHKYLYEEKNNYNNNKIIWYLPALNEYLGINGKWADRRYEFNTQLGILKQKGYTNLSTYAQLVNDYGTNGLYRLVSSTIYRTSSFMPWIAVSTSWNGTGDYYTSSQETKPDYKARSLYMAQVDLSKLIE